MKKDDFVKVIGVDGNYRYGYIYAIKDRGSLIAICFDEEGESKVAYDQAYGILSGEGAVDYISLLTEVEKRIVPLLSSGLTTNEIAEEMNISPTTVRAHLRTLRIKLHLDDRAQLIAFSQGLETLLKAEK